MKKKHSPEKQNFRNQTIYSIVYLLIWGAILVGLNVWLQWPGRPELVPYSEFLAAVEEAEVARVTLGERDILWTAVAENEVERLFLTQRIPGIEESELIQRLHEAGVIFDGRQANPLLGTLLSWIVPILLLALVWRYFLGRLPGSTQALSFGRNRARIWDASEEDITYKDVAGVDEAVTELQEVVDYLKNGEKYERLGAKVPKGILLFGPPGTGKTLLARATAAEAGVPFFSLSGADFVEMFVGVGAARVRDLFQQARAKAPCIIFIDELDTIGRSRAGQKHPMSHEEREQTLNQLLVEMDGFDSSTGVILMGATNRPDVLDSALLRPGRFDRQILVDKPDINGRQAILEVHTRGVLLDENVDLRLLAARTPGFAGAELANLVNEAALLAARNGRQAVTMTDLEEAIDRVMAGLERKSRALNRKERQIVAYHEMGHALVGQLLPHADPVHKVSIIPRGAAALGVTIQVPLEDRYLLSEKELCDRMTVLLGGRAAEELIFGCVSTGAADDLQKATALARRMVTQYGMNKSLGPVALTEQEHSYVNELGVELKSFSEKTAELIDQEVQELITTLYERAKLLLESQKPLLHRASALLLEKEVMDGEELAQLLEENPSVLNDETPLDSAVTI